MPKGHVIPQENITVLQDIFPEIFNYLTHPKNFNYLKVDPVTLDGHRTAGAYVEHGIIRGGVNDGEPLFGKNASFTH